MKRCCLRYWLYSDLRTLKENRQEKHWKKIINWEMAYKSCSWASMSYNSVTDKWTKLMKQTLTINCSELCYYIAALLLMIVFNISSYISTSQRNVSQWFTIQTAARTCLRGTVYEELFQGKCGHRQKRPTPAGSVSVAFITIWRQIRTANTTCSTIIVH